MSAESNPPRHTASHRNCPRCGSSIELVADGPQDEVQCPSCGSSFQLDPDRTQMWSKDNLPQLGKFELIEQLGRGAFGTVYRARDTQLQRTVAVKVPRSGQLMTDEDEDRFVREARNAAQLHHPGIIPVYEVGRSDAFPYIVSEYVEGITLADALTGRKFGFRESAELVAQIAAALEHAHAQGVVHRDLKPSNIMITPDGAPRVMDFGLAKRDAGEITMTLEGQVLGTPAYMSPEQASGGAHHVDGRSDVYSLGAILYELLTGRLPFAGNQRMLLHQVLHDEPCAPRSLNDGIPRDLETICLKAMAKEPGRRYQSACAMADDLARYLAGQPIEARPVGRLERSWRWCRRNPVVAGLTTTVAILALALGALAIWPAGDVETPVLDSLAIVLDSADEASEYLRDEVARNLIGEFSRISALKVRPRSDVLSHEDSDRASIDRLGQDLGVKAILVGSVHAAGDQLHIDLRLVGVDDNLEIWNKHFTGKKQELLGLQAGILRTVANRLSLELTPKEKRRLAQPSVQSQAALLHFLKGRELQDRGTGPSLKESVKEYEQAIALAPGFAEAYGALAVSYFSLGYMRHGEPKAYFEKARANVDKALDLDETLVEAKLIDGGLQHFFEWNWEKADRILEEVLELDSSLVETHSCYLHSHDARGRSDESLLAVRSALMRQPNSFAIRAELGCASYYAHEFENSLDAYQNVLKDDPNNYKSYWGLGRAYGQLRRYDEAIEALETGQAKGGGQWNVLLSELAYAYAKSGQQDKARKILDELRRREKEEHEFVDPYAYAIIYVGLGDNDNVFRQLNRAYEVKSPPLPSLNTEPKFTHLRDDPRFQELARRLRFRQSTKSSATGGPGN